MSSGPPQRGPGAYAPTTRSPDWTELADLFIDGRLSDPSSRTRNGRPMRCVADREVIRRGWGFFRAEGVHQKAHGCSRRSSRWLMVVRDERRSGHRVARGRLQRARVSAVVDGNPVVGVASGAAPERGDLCAAAGGRRG
jgi:hypothetical protein